MAKFPLALWLILLAALAVRVGWAATRSSDDASLESLPDQREYLECARSLRNGEGLSFTDPRFNQRVYAYRTPGYPLFLAMTGPNARVARILQAILDTSSALAVYLLARRWLLPTACLFASLLVAFNPFLVYFTGLLLTETLFTAMLAWGMFFVTSRRTLAWLLGAILLTASILVRPGALPLPILLGVLASLAVNRNVSEPYHRRWWALPVGTSMLILTILVLLPWALRNHRVVGAWVWTSTNGGITRYDGFNPDATGASDQSFVDAMPQLKFMTETERNDYLSREADNFIHAHPADALRLAGRKIARTWSPRPLSTEFARREYVLIALAYSVPFLTMFVLGWLTSPMPATAKLFLAAPAAYLTAAAALSVGSLRYRIPAEVPMAIVAAAGAFYRRDHERAAVAPAD